MLDEAAKYSLTQLGWVAARMLGQARLLHETVERCWRKNSIEELDEMVAYTFNARDFPPAYSGSSQLPVGRHPVKIVGITLDRNKEQTGGFMAIVTEAFDGPAKGQRHTDRLNLYHTNPLTVEIANKQLSAYCHLVGLPDGFTDTEQLIRSGVGFVQDIGLQKNSTEYTEVKSLCDLQGNPPGVQGGGQQQQQQAGNGGPPAGFGPQGGGVPDNTNNGGGGNNGGQGGWGNGPQDQGNNQQNNQGNQQQGNGQQGNGGGWGGTGGSGGSGGQGGGQQQQPAAGGGAWGQQQGGGAAGGQQAPWGPR